MTTKQIESFGIHWFRRDLRVLGNQALQENWKRSKGKVLGVFCFDKKFLSRDDFSHSRFTFFLESLDSLQKELRSIGSDLLFLDIGPKEAFPFLWQLTGGKQASTVSWNRDYEPFARKRDKEMQTYFADNNIEVITHRDHLVIEPHEIIKPSQPDQPYQVYSPFQKQWLKAFSIPEVKARINHQTRSFPYLNQLRTNKPAIIFSLKWDEILDPSTLRQQQTIFDHYYKSSKKHLCYETPSAGTIAAFKQLDQFADSITQYSSQRDLPFIDGTSRLSAYLKNGTITASQIIARLDLSENEDKSSGRFRFLAELIWREFYYYIMTKFPRVENEAFLTKFKSIPWENNIQWFQSWKEGKTGFPIVDAGMRQLLKTGWMHNRVRMIVASFLCKDLLIDWRWGEQYFMEMLIDGDLAPNNGGWQWAASTGCDPQPYFRIFNPLLQSKKFDPEGAYIRKFIPELSHLDARSVHEPSKQQRQASGYPDPIVDHKEQRNKALELYTKIAKTEK